jgi:hypothetical protein
MRKKIKLTLIKNHIMILYWNSLIIFIQDFNMRHLKQVILREFLFQQSTLFQEQ